MKNNNNTIPISSQTTLRNQAARLDGISDPEPLYRQEKSDVWDAILHALLELCLPAALVLCGMSMSGLINHSKPASAAAAQVAATHVTVNPGQGFKVAAR